MKLVSLKIKDRDGFRGLRRDFTIKFSDHINERDSFHPHILVGSNGSGKSNVLEVIANIFFHVECRMRENLSDDFFNSYDFIEAPSPKAFELKYYINVDGKNEAITIEKEEEGKILFWKVNKKEREKISDFDMKKFLPDNIIAYSTGSNEILSLPFLKMRYLFFDAYINDVLTQGKVLSMPQNRLLYLNFEYSQAILISNLLLQEESKLQIFKEILGIKHMCSIEIIIKDKIVLSDEQIKEYDDISKDSRSIAKEFLSTIDSDTGKEQTIFYVTKAYKEEIEYLKRCATSVYYDQEKNELYLNYFINDETKKAFKEYFGDARQLFNFFQVLLSLNLYTTSKKIKSDLYKSDSLYVNETVPNPASDQRVIRFKDVYIEKDRNKEILTKALSDGEYQLLHIIGIFILYNQEKNIFLLDEPETHLNPQWRSKYITNIRNSVNQTEVNFDMLITTHTPYIVSDSMPNFVHIIKKDSLKSTHPEYNTFGASVSRITTQTFRQKSTIGFLAQGKVDKIFDEIENLKTDEDILKQVESIQSLGESVEKLLLMEKLVDRKEDLEKAKR